MPEKDFREKRLKAINEVFADILNVLLFNGERRVRAEDLRNEFVRTGYNFEEKFEEQERDVKKIWMS
ncbi:MAG: transposase, partial [Clostridia bacterium]|nr:transposase [Clostridia bacterium]